MDSRYEKVNEIGRVGIKLASPTDIRNWSYLLRLLLRQRPLVERGVA